jgi:hypothetical protein
MSHSEKKDNPIYVQHPAKMQLPRLIAFMHQFGNLLSELEKDKIRFEVEPGIVEAMEAALRAHGWQEDCHTYLGVTTPRGFYDKNSD